MDCYWITGSTEPKMGFQFFPKEGKSWLRLAGISGAVAYLNKKRSCPPAPVCRTIFNFIRLIYVMLYNCLDHLSTSGNLACYKL